MRTKQLLPLGGKQNLRKPMPRHTRYVGETCPAWDIKGRYEEHMRKQRERAAAHDDTRAPKGSVA